MVGTFSGKSTPQHPAIYGIRCKTIERNEVSFTNPLCGGHRCPPPDLLENSGGASRQTVIVVVVAASFSNLRERLEVL